MAPEWLARAWGAAAALLWPARCLGCGRRDAPFCPACWAALPRLRPPLCPRCSKPERGGMLCAACRRRDPALSAVRAACAYQGAVVPAVQRLKYRHERHLVAALGRLLLECLAARPLAIDALLPVPLDARRARWRGFNQSALLAAARCWPTGCGARGSRGPRWGFRPASAAPMCARPLPAPAVARWRGAGCCWWTT